MDFLIEVVVCDMVTYEVTVLNRLLSLPELHDIRTSFAMHTYRSTGSAICGLRLGKLKTLRSWIGETVRRRHGLSRR